MNQKEDATRFVDAIPQGEHVVAMVVHAGTIYVAVASGVYRLEDGVFREMLFVPSPKNVSASDQERDAKIESARLRDGD